MMSTPSRCTKGRLSRATKPRGAPATSNPRHEPTRTPAIHAHELLQFGHEPGPLGARTLDEFFSSSRWEHGERGGGGQRISTEGEPCVPAEAHPRASRVRIAPMGNRRPSPWRARCVGITPSFRWPETTVRPMPVCTSRRETARRVRRTRPEGLRKIPRRREDAALPLHRPRSPRPRRTHGLFTAARSP